MQLMMDLCRRPRSTFARSGPPSRLALYNARMNWRAADQGTPVYDGRPGSEPARELLRPYGERSDYLRFGGTTSERRNTLLSKPPGEA